MPHKKEIYKWVKLAGFASFIPLVLAAYPLTGFLVGDYIRNRFYPQSHPEAVFSLIGLCAAIVEVIRIIRAMIKAS